MVVTRATLRTSAWDTIYTYIQTTNPISTDNIYSSFNSKLVADVGYPIVILAPPDVNFEKENVTGDYTMSTIEMRLDIYDDNAQDTKTLADNVTAKLMAGRFVFAGQRMMRMKIDKSDYDTWQDGSRKVHMISYVLEFVYIGNA